MTLRTAGILLKKEAGEFFGDFTRARKSADIPGKLLSLVLAAAIVTFACFVLKRFADCISALRSTASKRLTPAFTS